MIFDQSEFIQQERAEKIRRAKHLRKQGNSLAIISTRLGVHYTTVAMWLKGTGE